MGDGADSRPSAMCWSTSTATAVDMTRQPLPVDEDVEDCMLTTQRLFGGLIRPQLLNEHLLSQPPVKLIRDIFTEVMVATGCGTGLFGAEELENLASCVESRLAFLTILLQFVAVAVNEPDLTDQVCVGKMAAGLEPENAHVLLQRLHQAATDQVCVLRWPSAVRAARQSWESTWARDATPSPRGRASAPAASTDSAPDSPGSGVRLCARPPDVPRRPCGAPAVSRKHRPLQPRERISPVPVTTVDLRELEKCVTFQGSGEAEPELQVAVVGFTEEEQRPPPLPPPPAVLGRPLPPQLPVPDAMVVVLPPEPLPPGSPPRRPIGTSRPRSRMASTETLESEYPASSSESNCQAAGVAMEEQQMRTLLSGEGLAGSEEEEELLSLLAQRAVKFYEAAQQLQDAASLMRGHNLGMGRGGAAAPVREASAKRTASNAPAAVAVGSLVLQRAWPELLAKPAERACVLDAATSPCASKSSPPLKSMASPSFGLENRCTSVAAGPIAQGDQCGPAESLVEQETSRPRGLSANAAALPAARRPAKRLESRSLHKTKAGVLCEHIECHPSELYDIEEKVGEGSFGSVARAILRDSGSVRAIKMIPKNDLDEKSLWSEIAIMRQVDHPHVMKLYSTFEDVEQIYMVFELCSGGQLFDAIVSRGALSEATAARLMQQMLAAVCYLHQRYICHRDLKPENFMVAAQVPLEDAHLKLIDFGTAKRFDLAEMTTKVCTLHYVAPELLKSKALAYTEKCDLWSCGVILYVMLAGAQPFDGEDDMEILKKVKKGKFAFEPQHLWAKVSDDARSMVNSLLCVAVQRRYSAFQALRDGWVQELATRSSCSSPLSSRNLHRMRTYSAFNKLKKLSLQVIAQHLEGEHISKLTKVFLDLDQDKKGALLVEQVAKEIEKLDLEAKMQQELKRMLRDMANGTGEINYTQFLAANLERQHYMTEDACNAAFVLFDVDGDGLISRQDLEAVFSQSLGSSSPKAMPQPNPPEGISPFLLSSDEGQPEHLRKISEDASLILGVNREDIERILREGDSNGNGCITFEDFVAMMTRTIQSASRPGSAAPSQRGSVVQSPELRLRSGSIDHMVSPLELSRITSPAPDREEEAPIRSPRASQRARLSLDAVIAALSIPNPINWEEKQLRGKYSSQPGSSSVMTCEALEEHDTAGSPRGQKPSLWHRMRSEGAEGPRASTKRQKNSLSLGSVARRPTVIFQPPPQTADDKYSNEATGPGAIAGMGIVMAGGATSSTSSAAAGQPNPLWQLLQHPQIPLDRLAQLLKTSGIADYVNLPLSSEEGVPPALFFAVRMRCPALVRMLLEQRADVRRRLDTGSSWKGVAQGWTPLQANTEQKGKFVGIPAVYERCEATESLLKAEEDSLRGWRRGKQASMAAERYFSKQDFKSAQMVDLALVAEEEARLAQRSGFDRSHLGGPEALLSRKCIYSSVPSFVVHHVAGHPSEAHDLGEALDGGGTFGSLCKAVERLTGLERSVKTVSKAILEGSHLWQEVDLLRDLDHPSLPRLFGSYEDADSIFMVLEPSCGAKGVGLLEAVVEACGLAEAAVCPLFEQMLQAVSYIHRKSICHRDLKPENFHLAHQGSGLETALVRLLDFSTARRFGRGTRPMTTKVCTIHYVAPEILTRNAEPYTEKCDIWSLGVCLFVMLGGESPFHGDCDTAVLKRVRKGRYQFEPQAAWCQVSEEATTFITRLLVMRVSSRLGAHQALEDVWFLKARRQAPSPSLLKQLVPRLRSYRSMPWLKRRILEMIAHRLPFGAEEEIRSLHHFLDRQRRGYFDSGDLAVALAASFQAPMQEEASKASARALLLQSMEQDGERGEIGYVRLLAAMFDREKYLTIAMIRSAFRLLDLDENGYMSRRELRIALDVQGTETQEDEPAGRLVDSILQRYCRDTEQGLSFPELLAMMREDELDI
eukprot:TRINITY_DN15198_c0_g1_i1.p1 TRINITY_DN15198_c0_g1~~TRINITY_DN15198_c0_g1_i1.p1  ORF type:complete len:1942 (+),score=468.09 TRINITY_DN15198_c0_g1_i1:62-5827(+)